NDTNETSHTHNINDTPWTRPDTSVRRAGNGAQRLRVLLGTAAAVLIVALLAGALLTRPHEPAAGNVASTPTPGLVNQTGTATTGQGNYANNSRFARAAGKCDPGKITA